MLFELLDKGPTRVRQSRRIIVSRPVAPATVWATDSARRVSLPCTMKIGASREARLPLALPS